MCALHFCFALSIIIFVFIPRRYTAHLSLSHLPCLPLTTSKGSFHSLTPHSLTFSLSHTLFSNVLHSSTHRYTKTMAARRGPYVVSPRSGRLHWVTKKISQTKSTKSAEHHSKPEHAFACRTDYLSIIPPQGPVEIQTPKRYADHFKEKKGTRKRLQSGIVHYVIW